jgi:hypothetical protein
MTERVSSSADSFAGSLNADGFTTTIDPFAPVSGSAPPAYDDTSSIASFDHTYDLTPVTAAESNILSLEMQASHMVNTAASLPQVIADQIGAIGTADLGSASFTLTDSPNPMLPLSILGLSVEATGIHSESNSSFGPTDEGFLSGDASLHSLTVTGPLVNGDTLTFSGNAAKDTVLYKSSTVTITLDDQTVLLPPSAAASGIIGPTIFTDAIDIQLNHAKFAGQTITGNFDIGQSSASYSLIPPAHA